jgi:hypothetical protein
VQWVLAIPHLAIASVLSSLRHLLIAISLVTVLFTKRITRQVFDTIAMTYGTNGGPRAMRSSARPLPAVRLPAGRGRRRTCTPRRPSPTPMRCRGGSPSTWLLAVPHYVVLPGLASIFVVLFARGRRRHRRLSHAGPRLLVGVYRYGLRVQAYIGLLTDQYPPFAVRS